MDIYKSPMSETMKSDLYPENASKRLTQTLQAFGLNAVVAATTIVTNKLIDPQFILYLSRLWMATTVLYGVACGAFFYQFGRLKWLWSVTIVVSQPIGVLISIVILVYRGLKHGWYKNA